MRSTSLWAGRAPSELAGRGGQAETKILRMQSTSFVGGNGDESLALPWTVAWLAQLVAALVWGEGSALRG